MFGYSDKEFERLWEEIMYPKLKPVSLPKDFDNPANVNLAFCKDCGGKCCQKCGCHFSPDDFKEISFEFLKEEICTKGYISIDYVPGEYILQSDGVYILRVRNKEAPIFDAYLRNYRKPCILLGEQGCKLSYEERPAGGRLLIPSDKIKVNSFFASDGDRFCYSSYDIEECCYEWRPYKKLLYELSEYFKDKDVNCSL